MNMASWFGNYELDVIVEDEDFGRQMEQAYLKDLERSTEIVLADTDRVRLRNTKKPRAVGTAPAACEKRRQVRLTRPHP